MPIEIPHVTLTRDEDGRTLVIDIELNGVEIASKIDAGFLDARTFELDVPDLYRLLLPLDGISVDDDAPKCKFDKATQILRVTVPIVSDDMSAPASVPDEAPHESAEARLSRALSTAVSTLCKPKSTHVIIEDFLRFDEASSLLSEAQKLRREGKMRLGKVEGSNSARAFRGDEITWLKAGEGGAAVELVTGRVGELIKKCCGKKGIPELKGRKLAQEDTMITCYPGGGSRYMKHVDTMAESRRVLTAIVYLNPNYSVAEGGQLRLHLASGISDVEPRLGRLVLFWSDKRVPHEVMPSMKQRYACTMWYTDCNVSDVNSSQSTPGTLIDGPNFPPSWHDYVSRCRKQYAAHNKTKQEGLEACLGRVAANADAVGEMMDYPWHKMQVPDDATIKMFSQ